MFSSSVFSKQFSNRYFQLKFAQEKFNDLEIKLFQRLQCIQLQLINIEHICSNNPQNSQYLLKQTQKQYKNIKKYLRQLQIDSTQRLLLKQTYIEDQSQRHNLIRQYEQRIMEMGCNLYTKQVDITVDHIGKKQKQKPYVETLRQFSRISAQSYNVQRYIEKIYELKFQSTLKNISKSKIPNKQELFRNKTETTIRQHQIQEQKKQSIITKESSGQSESNPEVQDNKVFKVRRKLLLSSQKQIYEDKTYSDPQLTKILTILKKQLERQIHIKSQYINLKAKFRNECMENRELTKQYQKLLIKNKQNHLKQQTSCLQATQN